MARPIRFYFDYISHNAWLAWHEIHALAERHGRGVEPVAVLFAGLLNHTGMLGPAEVLPKALWMIRDLLRKSGRLGIPLEPPPAHPFNPLLALRVSSLDMADDERRRLVDGLFRACWAGGGGVTDPEIVARVADAAGLDGAALVRRAGEPDAKARLRAQTDAAIEAGVFGVPSMLVDGELFFGFDDFRSLEEFLAGEDPLDRSRLAAWHELPRGAERRRTGGAERRQKGDAERRR